MEDKAADNPDEVHRVDSGGDTMKVQEMGTSQAVQVCGVPDAKSGEEVWASIQLKPGSSASEAELREFCQNQMPHYKIPRYSRFVADSPMTIIGKVHKFAKRERLLQRGF
jgi:acyl-CoA synthetase (AMP-forming)/AMP-acid ligase II